jgi:hypothetical protein
MPQSVKNQFTDQSWYPFQAVPNLLLLPLQVIAFRTAAAQHFDSPAPPIFAFSAFAMLSTS